MTAPIGEQRRRREFTRRRFLQAALALGGAAALDPKLFGSRAWAGAPLGPSDRIFVLIELAGGNDGLNTLVPVADANYAALRGSLAIPAAATLDVGEGLALHPNLTYLKSRFDAGDVAIVRGVGHGDKDHSHFSCMAKVMAGTPTGVATTGLLGRWLDGSGLDGFGGINVGDGEVPLILQGQHAEVTGLPTYGGLFGSSTQPFETVAYNALTGLGDDTLGLGPWGDVIADMYQAAIQRARDVNRIYSPNITGGSHLAHDLTLAARLINLDLGARVITVLQGGYDTHSGQLDDHARLMTNLDTAISTFFQNLGSQFHNRVVVMTYSEFGRRPRANDSAGTDHGTASILFLVGNHARGGLHGAQPSLSQLDSRGDLNIAVDVRSVFASVLGPWLGADDAQVLGAAWPKLDLFDPYSGAGYPDPTLPAVAYQSLSPLRILDTRSGIGLGRVVRVGPGETIDLPVAGQANVPATGAGAVIANVTVTGCDAPSYLTVWPTGAARPEASNLNMVPGQTVPNLVLAKLGSDGKISIFNANGSTDVIVDIAGWFPAGNVFAPLVPARVLDTRLGIGAPKAKLGPRGVIDLKVVGRGGVPDRSDVAAVVLNVTVAEPDTQSYITVWPTGSARPDASNLNMAAGQTVPNMVIAKVGSDGMVSLFNEAGSTHLLTDVLGWFPFGSGYNSLTPSRILDTRSGNGAAAAKVGPTGLLELQVAGRAGVPPTATSAALNVTATDADAVSYVTVWPAGSARPEASNLNTVPGVNIANLVVAKLGTGGKIDFFNYAGTVHLIADVMGWFD